jgi:hypothetical protein
MYEAIKLALGEPCFAGNDTGIHTFTRYVLPEQAGVIKRLIVPDNWRENSSVTEVSFAYQEGDSVAPPPQSYDFLGYVTTRGKCPEEAEREALTLLSKIDIEIEPNQAQLPV